MLLKFFFNYLPLVAFALGTYSTNSAAGVDEDALRRERNKVLVLFSLEPYEQDVRNMNKCDNYDDPNEPVWTAEQGLNWAQQAYKGHLRREAARSPAQKAEEKRLEAEREEKERKITKEIEDKILQKILAFSTSHPSDKKKMHEILKAGKFQHWADFCEKAGDHFWKQKRHDDADYFYDLAGMGVGRYTQNYAPSSQGRMHLELYNQELTVNRPNQPTPSLFHNLQQAIWAFYDAGYCNDEVAEFALSGLKQQRNHIVRWHLSHQHVSRNVYLAEIAYAYDFVDRILSQASSLSLLRHAKRYDGSLASADLAKHLIDLGFWGIWQGKYEHNWVRPDGLMVRVKSKPVAGNPRQYAAEFTIGITAENPIIWGANKQPVALKKYADGSDVAFDEDNEVLKLAYDGKFVSVVPSRKVAVRWHRFGFSDAMMRQSHFTLPGGFGDAKNYYSTKKAWFSD